MQVEAFFEVARGDAGRLALLDDAQAVGDVGGAELVLFGEFVVVGAVVAVVVEFEGDDEGGAALRFAQVRHLVDLFFEPGAEVGSAAQVEFEVAFFFVVGLVVFPVVVVVFVPGAVVFEFAGEGLDQAVVGVVFAVFVFVAAAAAFLQAVVFALQHDVLHQHGADFGLQVKAVHVEQFDRLLQLRGEGEALFEAEV